MRPLFAFVLALAACPTPVEARQSALSPPDSTLQDSLLLRARAALDRGGLSDSLLSDLNAALRDAPGPHTARVLGILGRHYSLAGQVARLDTILSAYATLAPSDARGAADRHLLIAERYRMGGQADSALAHLGRALLLREGEGNWPAIVEVYLAYGRVNEQLLGDPGGALSYYMRAVAAGRDRAAGSALLPIAMLRSGHMASRLGRTNPALEFYRQADSAAMQIGLEGVSALAWFHLAQTRLQSQGRVQAAAADLRRAVDVAANDAGPYAVRARLLAYQLLGDIHYQYGSSHDSALAAYERAIASDEDAEWSALLIGAYRNAGIIHAWWERDARAEPFLRRATQLADGDGEGDLALSNRGHWITAMVRVGKLEEAIGALEPIQRTAIASGDGTLAVALGAIIQAVGRDTGNMFDAGPWAAALGTPATMDSFFRSAADMALARDDIESLLFALFEYGRSLQAAGRSREAQRHFRTAWNQAARKGRDDERRALERLIPR